jgi:hypothetical protein
MMYESILQILEVAQSRGFIEGLSHCSRDNEGYYFSILSFEKFRDFLQEIAEETDCLEEQEFVTQTLEVLSILDKQQACIQESDITKLREQLDSCKTVHEFLQSID